MNICPFYVILLYMELNPIQDKLWHFLAKRHGDTENLSLRDLGDEIGIGRRAQMVAHHLEQLEKKGLIKADHFRKGKYTVYQEPTPDAVYIPLYECSVQCGPDGLSGDDNVIDRVALSPQTFRITDPKDYFLIRARGRSMEPRIHEGDLVLAKRQSAVTEGGLMVIVHNEMPKIKQVAFHTVRNKKTPVLVSLNHEFEKQSISEDDDDLRIVGEVKGVIRLEPFSLESAS